MERINCNLCGSDQTKHMFTKFKLGIVRCRNCGLVYAGPERLTREETWARYNPHYFHEEYLPALGITDERIDLEFFDRRNARPLAMVRPFRQLGTLFEVGCGGGLFLKSAERDGWQVQGIEVMDAGVAFARERLGLNVRSETIETTNVAPASCDVVVMMEVIEHLSDPTDTLRRVIQLLRPGGWLLITTPNIEAISRYALGECWAVLSPAEHLYYFSQDSLGQMLRRAGYGTVWFDRHYADQGLYETMFPTHNQAPESPRARAYTAAVNRFGPALIKRVQAAGRADGLWCLVQRPLG